MDPKAGTGDVEVLFHVEPTPTASTGSRAPSAHWLRSASSLSMLSSIA